MEYFGLILSAILPSNQKDFFSNPDNQIGEQKRLIIRIILP